MKALVVIPEQAIGSSKEKLQLSTLLPVSLNLFMSLFLSIKITNRYVAWHAVEVGRTVNALPETNGRTLAFFIIFSYY